MNGTDEHSVVIMRTKKMTTATPGGTLSHKVVFPEKRAIIVTVTQNARTAKEKRQRGQKKAVAPAERGSSLDSID